MVQTQVFRIELLRAAAGRDDAVIGRLFGMRLARGLHEFQRPMPS
jgi:hypothetical protein